jgi:UPF0176 protein
MSEKKPKKGEYKVLLFYKFVPLEDPETAMLWQKALCEKLNLTGRVILAKQGINGTLGGTLDECKAYVKTMKKHSKFKDTQYKWSEGTGSDFPKLSVKVREELVTLAPGEEFDVFNKSKGLSPQQWHDYLTQNPDVTLLDARNVYESEIGAFKAGSKNLIAPKINAFREIKDHLDDIDKEKPVLTYCTGDVRCEYLSAYMKDKGFKEVYHLEGGIVKYGQQFGEDGFWDGKCFTFDDRMKLDFAHGKGKDIAKCRACGAKTSEQINCEVAECNELQVICPKCQDKGFKCIKCGKVGAGRKHQDKLKNSHEKA